MAIFDFVENFFFISLAITFALVLLLVYHFKQRISLVERKGDTMFELLTNVVKELKCVKKLNTYYESIFSNSVPDIDTCMFAPPAVAPPAVATPAGALHAGASTEYKIIDLSLTPITPEKVASSLIPVSDDSESDDEDSESGEEDDESNTGESDYESTSDSESDDEDEEYEPPVVLEEVVPLDLAIEELVQLKEPVQLEELVQPEELDVEELVQPEELAVEELVQPEEVVAETKEVEEVVAESNEVAESEQAKNGPTSEQKREVYRKMNITQLKTLAVAASITADVSKMKKLELIKLLESLDE